MGILSDSRKLSRPQKCGSCRAEAYAVGAIIGFGSFLLLQGMMSLVREALSPSQTLPLGSRSAAMGSFNVSIATFPSSNSLGASSGSGPTSNFSLMQLLTGQSWRSKKSQQQEALDKLAAALELLRTETMEHESKQAAQLATSLDALASRTEDSLRRQMSRLAERRPPPSTGGLERILSDQVAVQMEKMQGEVVRKMEDLKIDIQGVLRSGSGENLKLVEEVSMLRGTVKEHQNALREGFKDMRNTVASRILPGGNSNKLALPVNETEQRLAKGEYRNHWIKHDDPAIWRQRTFKNHGYYNFVKYSSYRLNRTTVAMLGLARTHHIERQVGGCVWHGANGDIIDGSGTLMLGGEHHEHAYEFSVFYCTLKTGVSSSGGYLLAHIDQEEIVAFTEEVGQPLEVSAPFPEQMVYCSAPMYGSSIKPKRVREWFDYHISYMNLTKFILYDAGAVGEEMMAAIQPYIDAGMVEISDFRDVAQYETWWWGQALAMHDCAFRNRHVADWVLFHDFDEYLEVSRPYTMNQILTENRGQAYLTHGCLAWDVDKCNDKSWDNLQPLERISFHWPGIYCSQGTNADGGPLYPDVKKCENDNGHRKLIADPRQVELMAIHIVMKPYRLGIDLSYDVIRHHHFHGLAVMDNAEMCTEIFSGDRQPDWWVYDEHLATIQKAIRECPRGSKNCTLTIPQYDPEFQ